MFYGCVLQQPIFVSCWQICVLLSILQISLQVWLSDLSPFKFSRISWIIYAIGLFPKSLTTKISYHTINLLPNNIIKAFSIILICYGPDPFCLLYICWLSVSFQPFETYILKWLNCQATKLGTTETHKYLASAFLCSGDLAQLFIVSNIGKYIPLSCDDSDVIKFHMFSEDCDYL